MKNNRFFLSENFHFLVVKCSIHLNRRVFVMRKAEYHVLSLFFRKGMGQKVIIVMSIGIACKGRSNSAQNKRNRNISCSLVLNLVILACI